MITQLFDSEAGTSTSLSSSQKYFRLEKRFDTLRRLYIYIYPTFCLPCSFTWDETKYQHFLPTSGILQIRV